MYKRQFQYLSTIAFDVSNGYYFAADKKTQTVGGYADILANPDVTWETSEQLNIGLDARFARGRLGLAFDWYQTVSFTHLRAHETVLDLVCRLLLEKKKKTTYVIKQCRTQKTTIKYH